LAITVKFRLEAVKKFDAKCDGKLFNNKFNAWESIQYVQSHGEYLMRCLL